MNIVNIIKKIRSGKKPNKEETSFLKKEFMKEFQNTSDFVKEEYGIKLLYYMDFLVGEVKGNNLENSTVKFFGIYSDVFDNDFSNWLKRKLFSENPEKELTNFERSLPLEGGLLERNELIKIIEDGASLNSFFKKGMELFLQRFSSDYKKNKISNITEKFNNPFYPKKMKSFAIISAISRSYDSSLGNTVGMLSEVVAEKIGGFTPCLVNKNGHLKMGVSGFLTTKVINYIDQVASSDNLTIDETLFHSLSLDKSLGFELKIHFSDLAMIDSSTCSGFIMEGKLGGNLDSKNMKENGRKLLIQKAIMISIYPNYNIKHFLSTQYNYQNMDGTTLDNGTVGYFGKNNCLIGKAYWLFITNNKYPNIWEDLKSGIEEGVPDNFIDTLISDILKTID